MPLDPFGSAAFVFLLVCFGLRSGRDRCPCVGPSSRLSPEPDSTLRFPPGSAASKAVGLLAASRGSASGTPIASAPPHGSLQTRIFCRPLLIHRLRCGNRERSGLRAPEIRLREQRSDVQAQGVEDLCAEAILLNFGLANEVAHRRRAESSQKTKNCAFLDQRRRASRDQRLGGWIVAQNQAECYAASLERLPQRRVNHHAHRRGKSPVGLTREAHEPASFAIGVHHCDVADQGAEAYSEEEDLRREV